MSLNLYSVIKSELRVIARAIEAGCNGTETQWEDIYDQIMKLAPAAAEDLASEKSGYRIEHGRGDDEVWSCKDCGVIQSKSGGKCCEDCHRPFKKRRG